MRLVTLIAISTLFYACSVKEDHSSLTYLDLSNQKLKQVPDSVFRHKKLQTLLLGNSFTFYPPLSSLGRDEFATETSNTLSMIPEDIGELANLTVLSLSGNDLKRLPQALPSLRKLDTLDLLFNANVDISKELATLKRMRHLKYLGLFGTRLDSAVSRELKQFLPDTKVITTVTELEDAFR